eukprot:6177423-Pleurochrysis_carterae.AAC.1
MMPSPLPPLKPLVQMGGEAKGPQPSGTDLRVLELRDEQSDLRSRLRRAQRGYRQCLYLLAQDVLAEIGAVSESSPSIALDREAPFAAGGKGSGVPLALSSKVGTQGKSRVRARAFAKSPLQSGLERRKGEARPQADAFWRLGRATSGVFISFFV